MNVERDVGQCTIWKFTNFWMTSQLQWFWKTCRKTHNLKIHKWSQGKSIAMNEDRGAGRHTILQSEMVGWQVDCNVCGKRCRRTHNLKIHKWSDVKSIASNVERDTEQCTISKSENDRMASRLHRKTPLFRVKSVKNATFSRKICRKCQFSALNL